MQIPCNKSAGALMDMAPLSIVMLGNNGKIIYANEKTSSLFGYPVRELVGQPLAFLFNNSYSYQYPKYGTDFFTRLCNRMTGMDMGVTGLCRDGTEIPVQIRFASINDDVEELIVVYILDIHIIFERKLMDDEARSFKNRLGLYILDDG